MPPTMSMPLAPTREIQCNDPQDQVAAAAAGVDPGVSRRHVQRALALALFEVRVLELVANSIIHEL